MTKTVGTLEIGTVVRDGEWKVSVHHGKDTLFFGGDWDEKKAEAVAVVLASMVQDAFEEAS